MAFWCIFDNFLIRENKRERVMNYEYDFLITPSLLGGLLGGSARSQEYMQRQEEQEYMQEVQRFLNNYRRKYGI
jgi:hypothetical protein